MANAKFARWEAKDTFDVETAEVVSIIEEQVRNGLRTLEKKIDESSAAASSATSSEAAVVGTETTAEPEA